MSMRRIIVGALLALTACKGASSNATPTATAAPAAAAPLQNDTERTLYALGLIMGERMRPFHLTPAELAVVQRGIGDQVGGTRPLVELDTWGPRVNEMARTRMGAAGAAPPNPAAAQERVRGRAFAETAAGEAGARRLPSGLVFREIAPGSGPQPTAQDTVRVNYRGKLIDGTEFDSSSQPITFPLSGVIPCWTEGVQLMHVGGRARLVCPAEIAYGDRSPGRIPAGATLDFEVELLGIEPAPSAPATAAPATAAPATAAPATAPAH